MYFTACPVHDHTRIVAEPSQPFRFLDLPAEIRVRIASYALSSSSSIRIRHPQHNRLAAPSPEPKFLTSPRLDYPLPRTPPPTPPCEDLNLLPPEQLTQPLKELQSRARDGHSRLALLMACRQTYIDHWATYYRHNEFIFTPSTWQAFSSKVPERCLGEIRHMRFKMPHRSRQMHTWRKLAELSNLETVTVVLAPPENASKLERANCVAGARMCAKLRTLTIERDGVGEGIAPLGEGEDAVLAKAAYKEDRVVEKCINQDLADRVKSEQSSRRRGGLNAVRKATSRAGSVVRHQKRIRIVEASPTPDEQAMDAYFHMVDSATDEEVGGEVQAV